ncbi:MAG: HAD family hydrolase [Oscillospiraceae bacterium]|jgi:Cof subfamily protein (haloacid dehalogenase superfamily)|nr:HAD family hydrolase [Oscillospiraceae bacterium]
MSKTLYLSDLDGTLLDGRSELSPRTLATLRRLINDGLHFSIATGRTAFSTEIVLRGLNLRLPAIQQNGVYLYDFAEKTLLNVQYIQEPALTRVFDFTRDSGILPLVYTVRDNVQTTHYERVTSANMQAFLDLREKKYKQRIPRVDRLESLSGDGVIYLCFIDTKERLAPLAAAARELPGICAMYSRDVSLPGDVWLLELFSNTASKAAGARYLREYGGFDRIVAFGDGINDLPLFAECEVGIAVSNASDEIKSAAAEVIGANTEDAVVRWLEENAEL